ncbi:MAG TPA: transketolase C-terminal domain-containing protein, partial [Candidatus Wallbacteria bacterium]|nr:transketolase C-terminal domain-containing protein [Candidatus Wallbacteria bacterium]
SYEDIAEGSSGRIYDGSDIAVIGVGRAVNDCKKAAVELKSRHNISVELIDARFIKPLDMKMVEDIGRRFKSIITVEENVITGGFGENFLAALVGLGFNDFKFKNIGIGDCFIEHGANQKLREIIGIDASGIVKTAVGMVGKK